MLRMLLTVSLALMLALTSQAMAVMRGASAATGQMVICNGNGTMTVYTDAQGTPTQAPHICPDCITTVAVDAPARTAAVPVRLVAAEIHLHLAAQIHKTTQRLGAYPRAPPLLG